MANNLLNAQTSSNISLVYQDKIDTLPINFRDSYYSECWGFTYLNEDYAVISSTSGTHIYHITDAENSYHTAYIPNPVNGYNANWRDFHDYNGFLYIVNDRVPGVLQIVDVRGLPDKVEVVYESDEFFSEAHNIFIDTATAKLYVCGATTRNDQKIDLGIYNLNNPQQPQFLNDYSEYGYIHDCFVRNDTAYIESPPPDNQTLYIVNFKDTNDPITLGSLTNYPSAGYTHAGWLSEDGQYYVLSDETYGTTIKLLDVSDLSDIKVLSQFSSGVSDSSMAHNPIIINDLVFVSYYNDGLQVFDISNPSRVEKVAYYDTYQNARNGGYRGAWGVYPFKNGKVIISDRQTGLYIFDASHLMEIDVSTNQIDQTTINVYPNPVTNKLFVTNESNIFNYYEIYSVEGKIMKQENINSNLLNTTISFRNFATGLYYLVLYDDEQMVYSEKILKTKN